MKSDRVKAMTPAQRALLVREGSRQWAGSLLEDLVQSAPTRLEMRQWARKNPHLYFNAMSVVGKLAGFEQQINVKHDINMRIYDMSDTELDAEIERTMLELQKKSAVEAELVEVQDESPRQGKKG